MSSDKKNHTDDTILPVFHTFPYPVFISSPEGIIVDTNEAFASRFGKTPKEYRGLNLFDYLPPELGARRKEMVKELLRTAQPVSWDDEWEGGILRHTIYPCKSSDGTLDRLLGIEQDITDIKQLLKKELRYSTIIESLPGAFYVLDADGRFVTWNANLRVTGFGRADGDMAETLGIETIHPDDRVRMIEKMEEIMHDGSELIAEVRVLPRGGGELKWYLMTGKRVLMDGAPFIVGLGIDITERKKADEAVQRSENRFRHLFEDHSAIKMLLDSKTGDIIDANPAAAEFYGYSVDELKSMNIRRISTATKEEIMGNLELMRSSKQKKFSFIHRRNDGQLRNVTLFTSCIRIGENDFLYNIIQDVTDQKLTEEALQQSEERFRKMFEDHSAIMLVINPQTGGILYANSAAAKFYGWTKEELCRMDIQQINTLSADEVTSEMNKIVSGQKTQFSFRHRRADNSIRDVNVFSDMIEIGGKELLYSIITDITERLESEQALKLSEERFRKMFEGHSAIMIVLDPETGAIVDANQSAADFYGWPIPEMRQMHIREINAGTPESVQEEMEKWKVMERRSMAFRHRRADGSVRDVEIFGNKIRIMGRNLVYDIVYDVTERKRFEKDNAFRLTMLQMAETYTPEQLMQQTVDEAEQLTGSSIGFAFFIAEDQNSILLQVVSTNTSQNFCQAEGRAQQYPVSLAGVWADALRERKVVIHNDYASLPNRKGMPACHAELIRELVVPIIREDKVMAIIGIGNKPGDYDENDVEWVSSLANQTWEIIAKKIAEEKGKKLQAQLEHAKKMQMIGQLSAGIAHEISNPLNFITLNAANLKSNYQDLCELIGLYRRVIEKAASLPDMSDELMVLREREKAFDVDLLLHEIPEIIEESQRGVQRISTITRSMRSFSFKNAADTFRSFDINKVVEEVLAIARNEYYTVADLEVRLDNLPGLIGNPSQINQVLLNLVINSTHAIKSQNRSTPGRIEIRTWATEDHIHCSVTDDGPGIPEEVRERIFSPFFTTKMQGEGTGLGLSISYDIIVEKHGGSFSFHNPEGGGTVFMISLPLNPRKSAVPDSWQELVN
ncbi:MAG: PAS domain S-box protein [Chlorobiaceae bacterium]|nr:PAS domain S-box protein [Chlorobiaceae bacterium]